MFYKVPLKNDIEKIVIDAKSYEFLNQGYYKTIKILENLRSHSKGYPVYQKQVGKNKYETIYLHKLLATKFIKKPEDYNKNWVVRFIDNNVKNLRLSNLEWISRSMLRRLDKSTNSSTGFRGVSKDGNRYRAVIYIKDRRTPFVIGRFDTPEEAYAAYRAKSKEIFGI